ncbi:hypothetical protein [Thalassospira lucentensis]|uniref:hypothetical protein n=1 Tax=Thalassospira lucentensis TaxID=168935 RepID=UPI00142E6671|nr:hypothetical protein [Thalassospira lucentensis]NIZ03873.1 hypothetical protein [Thalassospira lucentensis]
MTSSSLFRFLSISTFLLIVFACLPFDAHAQLNNKPYSFGTPDGSVGMSRAAKQAIINDQLFNVRPQNMLRGLTGELLSVEKSKGGTALVRDSAGATLPGYRGTNVFGSGQFAGAFNSYFVSDSTVDRPPYNLHARDAINGWINLVDTRGVPLISYGAPSPIDAWTSMVRWN